MPDLAVNPETVIQRLAAQIGQMSAEIAMRDAALEAQAAARAELEKQLAEKDRALEALRSSPAAETTPEA
ncbi:MAG: hypothetical protein HOU81_09865 [Hamadaea sp.]|nr:hypothetical protein [Catenulispora sp.]NUR71116.1 hypothetical protein [Hamadaea sp.]